MAAVLAAPKAAELAGRFWKGLLDGAGKPAITWSRQRVGRKTTAESMHVLGWEESRVRVGDHWEKRRSFAMARWEAALGVLAIGGYAAKRAGLSLPWPPGQGSGGLADWLNPLTSPFSGLSYMVAGTKAIISAGQSSGVITGVQSSSNAGYNRSVFSAITGKTYNPSTGTWS